MSRRFAVGVDFGTESGRALLVDVADGTEVATAVSPYRDGVIDQRLPDTLVPLRPEWALQNPADYMRALAETIPEVLRRAGADAQDVIGVGIDFTSCTMLPTTVDGTPLCSLDELRGEPHAWVKLWKHHAAQPQADRINHLAAERREPFLDRYGGRYSSEWFFSKALQILDEAPAVYERADRLIDAGDWIVWQLTGAESRSACTAGYKAMQVDGAFPSSDFFGALDERFANVVDEKLLRDVSALGTRAGVLSEDAAALTGLRPGTPVAVANVDAHVSAPAVRATEPGTMVIIMGTSNCHILLGERLAFVEGMCGVVRDGVLPGLFGYEAGQSGVGDIFAWFTALTSDTHDVLEAAAQELRPGESGLLALDWWNGNRSVLVDAELSGLVLGLSLTTAPAEIYRALLEATAFGTRMIVDAFEDAGVPVERIVACGGLPHRNDLLMQIYADVTGRELEVAGSPQAPALGSAIMAAVAAGADAGGYASVAEAVERMAPEPACVYQPVPAHHDVYSRLYEQYVRLHDLFGRDDRSPMKELRRVRDTARATIEVGS